MFYTIVKTCAKVLMRIFFPYRRINKQALKGKTGRIVVCNHLSGWDVPLAAVSVPFKMMYLGKKELFKNSFFGFLLKKLGGVPVDRENVSPATIRYVIGELKKGRSMLIFPEGTRNKNADSDEVILNSLKGGAAMFALMSGVPVQPMCIDKKSRIFRRNNIIAGELMQFGGEGVRPTKEAIADASLQIKECLESLSDELKEIKAAKKKKRGKKEEQA